MANLKIDLINDQNNVKYFAEMELVRLAQEPNMNYKEKVMLMVEELGKISMVNSNLGLIEVYFSQPEEKTAPAPNAASSQPKINQPSNGQSHGE